MIAEPIYTPHPDDGEPCFQGWTGSDCEHRTVGEHRAWCYDCTEWCYPVGDAACARCREAVTRSMVAGETETQKLDGIRTRWLQGNTDFSDITWVQVYDDVQYLLDLIEQVRHQLEK